MNRITLPRAVVEQAVEALELGHESARVEADRYHAAMAGYKPQRHAQMDAEVQQIAAAITALRAALAQQAEPVNVAGPAHLAPKPAPGLEFDERGVLVPQQTEPVHGWTDADADAARLALELECLLTDKDVPLAAASRWWGSAHEALQLHRKRLADALAQQAEPNVEYERGFIDGMQMQTKSSVDKAVNRMAEQAMLGVWQDVPGAVNFGITGDNDE